jgi:hypothetical protein
MTSLVDPRHFHHIQYGFRPSQDAEENLATLLALDAAWADSDTRLDSLCHHLTQHHLTQLNNVLFDYALPRGLYYL